VLKNDVDKEGESVGYKGEARKTPLLDQPSSAVSAMSEALEKKFKSPEIGIQTVLW